MDVVRHDAKLVDCQVVIISHLLQCSLANLSQIVAAKDRMVILGSPDKMIGVLTRAVRVFVDFHMSHLVSESFLFSREES